MPGLQRHRVVSSGGYSNKEMREMPGHRQGQQGGVSMLNKFESLQSLLLEAQRLCEKYPDDVALRITRDNLSAHLKNLIDSEGIAELCNEEQGA